MAASDASSTDSTSSVSGESPIDRAFRVLQVVVAAQESLGVLEVGRRSGLPRSTVSRLVATLTELGMVARTADGSVIPGSGLATLQPGGTSAPMLADQLRPLLAELVQTFGENAALSVDDGDGLLYLAQATGEHAVSVPAVRGERHPHHLVAPGLLTMAHWSDHQRDDHLEHDLLAATDHSWTDPDRLRERLATIHADGWCWTDQELDVGVNGLAVPVYDGQQLLATISLFGPSYRLNPTAHPTLATDVAALVANRTAALVSSGS